MAEPTLKTTSTPLDNQSQAEWRARVTTWLGISAFTSLGTLHQTEVDRLINAAHEYISQRLGHRPWMRRVATLSLVADQARYGMPADFRHLLENGILEGTGNSRKHAKIETQEEWRSHFPIMSGSTDSTATHPWDNQGDPHWVYRGQSADDPPVAVYQRVPTPTSAEAGTDNVTIDYRPLHELMDATNFSELPPSATEGIVAHLRASHAAFTGDFEKANFWRTMREDELSAGNKNDHKENEDPIRQDIPPEFEWEMGIHDGYYDRIYGD